MSPEARGLRVLKVCPAFPAGEEEGRDPWLLELVRRLREARLELEVLAPSREGRGGREEVCGVPVHRHRYAPRQAEILHRRVSGKRVLDGLWRLAFPGVGLVAAGAFAAGRLARRRGYAVIHAHWPLPAGLVALTGAGRAGKAASGRHLSRGGARRLRRQPAAAGSFGDRLRRARRGGGELQ